MITLITGAPGTGKTAFMLSQLLEYIKLHPNRRIYVHGVRDLDATAIPHQTLYCRSKLCDLCPEIPEDGAYFVEDWVSWHRNGDLLIIDEVQRIWRPRSGGTPPPRDVAKLETHRHYGLDFWLLSQGPHLFDNFIRLLVGRHIHLVSSWSGRKQYEWPECKQDVQSRSDAVVRAYTLPKHVFSLYKSAEVHTKQDHRKPLSFYALIFLGIIGTGLVGYLGYRIKTRFGPVAESGAVSGLPDSAAVSAPAPSSLPATTQAPPILSKYPDFTPSIPGVVESAPAYLPLLKVQSVPLLKGCIASESKCSCYTEQATIYPTTEVFCREHVKGNYFNPFVPSRTDTKETEKST